MESIEDAVVKMWKKHLLEQKNYVDEMRRMKHDLQGHLIVLQYYLDSENYEGTKCYIKEMQQNFDKFSSGLQIDLGNELVNAVVKECIIQSTEGIEFRSHGKLPVELSMRDYDLCTVFYNLAKNAVEACEKLSRYKKQIFIDFTEQRDCLEIMIKNPIEWDVSRKMLNGSTTKEDKKEHGYGIKNVIETVSKYKGEVNFEMLEDWFIVKVSLPKK